MLRTVPSRGTPVHCPCLFRGPRPSRCRGALGLARSLDLGQPGRGVFLVGGGYLAARNAVEVDAGRAGRYVIRLV